MSGKCRIGWLRVAAIMATAMLITPLCYGQVLLNASGRLQSGDSTLTSGEFFDQHTFQAAAGRPLRVVMTSSQFDPYLILVSPSGQRWENDDWEERTDMSRIDVVADQAGQWTVVATSFRPGESGAYALRVEQAPAQPQAQPQPRPASQPSPAPGVLLNVSGQLEHIDSRLTSGEFYDRHTFQAQAGQPISVVMTSSELDTYLILVSPSGEKWENDDWQNRTDISRIDVVTDQAGSWTVVATSFQPGETGRYALQVERTSAPQPQPQPAAADALLAVSGRLEQGDSTLTTGEFYDRHTFNAQAGQAIRVVMTSSQFDPYLILRSPSGQRWENDDWENRTDMSRIDVVTDQAGVWTIAATSYRPGEAGQYALRVEQDTTTDSRPTERQPLLLDQTGRLEQGDSTLTSGEFADRYIVDIEAGQSISLVMTSSEFDTYLIMVSPSGQRWENDDWENRTDISRIDAVTDQTGKWIIVATSFKPGETGAYRLQLTRDDTQAGGRTEQEPDAGAVAAEPVLLSETGRLQADSPTRPAGQYRSDYTFTVQAGRQIRATMTSTDVDTYLILRSPSGQTWENDDWERSLNISRIDVVTDRAGEWTVVASSYEPREVGAYAIRVEVVQDEAPAARRRVRGVFAGITDYPRAPNRSSPLPRCADDARMLHRAMMESLGMREEDAVVLADQAATTQAVRAAIERTLAQMEPDDVFVFFFSGHGDQVPIASGPPYPITDANGFHESIELWDGRLMDHELSQLLDNSPYATNMVIVLDSCFAGGFSNNVLTRPGRVGIFSSPDYMTSMTAGQLQAGGYVSAFITEAIRYRRADTNGDKSITAEELVSYLAARFSDDVKTVFARGESNPSASYVSPDSSRQRYQLLVSGMTVPPHHVLFGW